MRTLRSLGFVISLASLLVACRQQADSSEEPADEILQKPPFAPITDSIRQFPNDAALYFRRAEMLSQTNNHSLANPDYRKAWTLLPREETALRFAANLGILGLNKERLNLLEECRKKFPENRDFRRLMGETYSGMGNPQEALSLYQSMLREDSTDFETYYEEGLLQENLGDTAAALVALGHAYSLKPVNTYGLELAHLYAEKGDARALDLCDRFLANDPLHESVDPFFIRGIYYANTGKFSLAIVQFDSCIRRDWTFIDAHLEKGIALFRQKKYEPALAAFRLAATVSNTNPDAYYWTGRCYEAMNRKDEAMVQYERALGLDRNLAEAREALKRLQP